MDSPELSLAERRYLLDWQIRPALRTVPGVADVNALGGLVSTYRVTPRADALVTLGVTTSDIERAIRDNNRNDGAGRIAEGEGDAGAVPVDAAAPRVVVPSRLDLGAIPRDELERRIGPQHRHHAQQHDPDDLATVRPDGCGGQLDRVLLAGLGRDHQRAPTQVDAAALDETAVDRIPEGLAVGLVHQRHQLQQARTDGRGLAAAEHQLGGAVDIVDRPFEIGGHHTLADRVQGVARQRAAALDGSADESAQLFR